MEKIDLIILGMVIGRNMSAYEIAKDVECQHLSAWTRISVSSVYKKVISLNERGYLRAEIISNCVDSNKKIYSITNSGKEYFNELMDNVASGDVVIPIDFNLVIANINKIDAEIARKLLRKIRKKIYRAQVVNKQNIVDFDLIHYSERAIFEQLGVLYKTLLDWLNKFEAEFEVKNDKQ